MTDCKLYEHETFRLNFSIKEMHFSDLDFFTSSGQCPQWNELGKKLTKLIMFRRNNMPGEYEHVELTFGL